MRFCTSCGKALAGEAFCTSCGTPVPSSPDTAAPWADAPGPGRPRRRSPLTTGLVALTVVLAAAAAGTLLLRDEEPAARAITPAPVTSQDRDEAPEQPAAPEDSGEAPDPSPAPAPTAAPSSAPPAGAALPSTPFHVAIIASKLEAEGGAAAVQPLAAEIEAAGFPALVFSSQEHSSLRCCYWVAAAGPFPDAAAAGRAATAMRDLSPTFGTAYPRCVGQAAQCP